MKSILFLEIPTLEVEVGDEIISVNDEKVSKIAERLHLYMSDAAYMNRSFYSHYLVLNRPHAYFPLPELGSPVNVQFKKSDGKIYEGRYTWSSTKDFDEYKWYFGDDESYKESQKKPYSWGKMGRTESYFENGIKKLVDEKAIIQFGEQFNQKLKSDDDAEIDPVSRLKAYMLSHEGTIYGVLRIPSYSPDSFSKVLNELQWIREVLNRFESFIDVLIIDQVSNSGGYVYYVEQLVKFFTGGKILKGMTLNAKLNHTLIERWKSWSAQPTDVNDERVNYAEYALNKDYLQDMIEKFKNGEEWSGPMPSFGDYSAFTPGEVGSVFPAHDLKFSKKVVILNDRFSGSGGDFFPALLKKNKAALLVGELSAGLGGPVYRSVESLPGSELKMRSTYAYAEFEDGSPLENVGAIPDVVHIVHAEDLQDGFSKYAGTVLELAADYEDGATIAALTKKTIKKDKKSPLRSKRLKSVQKKLSELSSQDYIAEALYDLESLKFRLNVMKNLTQYENDLDQWIIAESLQELKTVEVFQYEVKELGSSDEELKRN